MRRSLHPLFNAVDTVEAFFRGGTDIVARLLMTLALGGDVLVPSLHPDDTGIG